MTLKLALAGALLLAGSAAASAHDPVEIAAPLPNPGNTAWMMTATILVLAMTVPGLALFYAGMVRAKNVLSVLMQVLIICAVVMLIWVFYGHRPPLDARREEREGLDMSSHGEIAYHNYIGALCNAIGKAFSGP